MDRPRFSYPRLPALPEGKARPWWEASSGILLVVLVALTFQGAFHLMRTIVALPAPRGLRRHRPRRHRHAATPVLGIVEAPTAAEPDLSPEVSASPRRSFPWSRQPQPVDSPQAPPDVQSAPHVTTSDTSATELLATPNVIGGAFAAWHYPAFVAGLATSLVAAGAYFTYWTLQGWVALQLGSTTFEVAALASIAGIPAVAFMIFGRPLADPLSNRGWVFTLRLIVVAILGWMALAASQDALTLPAFVATSALLGAVWCFDMPARFTRLSATVPVEHAANARAWQLVAQTVALAATPILAASILQGSDLATLLVIAAGAHAFVALAFLFVRARSTGDFESLVETAPFDVAREADDGALSEDAPRSKHSFRATLVIVPAVIAGGLLALAPLIARDVAKTDVLGYGWLLGSIGMGATLGLVLGIASGSGRVGFLLVLLGVGALAVAALMLAYTTTLFGVLVVFGIIGAGGGLSAGATFRARAGTTDEQARLASAAVLPWAALAPLGLLAGLIAERSGLPVAIWAVGVAAIGAIGLLIAFRLLAASLSTFALTEDLESTEAP